MENVRVKTGIRWIVLVFVLGNTIFNYLSNYLPVGKSIEEITTQYHTLFAPAPYAFGIWGLIYFSFVIYSIYQLLPAQQDKPIYNELAFPLILTNALASAWLIAFRNEYIGLSVLILFAMFNLGVEMFRRIKQARNLYKYNSWLTFPFSIFFAWITVANIANANTWFASMDWKGGALGETGWTVTLISAAILWSVMICIHYKDSLFPLVISWALIAIWVQTKQLNEQVATIAFVGGALLFMGTVAYMIKMYFSQKRMPYYTGRSVMKIVR